MPVDNLLPGDRYSLSGLLQAERRSRRRDIAAGLLGFVVAVLFVIKLRQFGTLPLWWSGTFFALIGFILAYSTLFVVAAGIRRPTEIAFTGGALVLRYPASRPRMLLLARWGPHMALEIADNGPSNDATALVCLRLPVPLRHKMWIPSAAGQALRSEAAQVGLEERTRTFLLLTPAGRVAEGTRYTFRKKTRLDAP